MTDDANLKTEIEALRRENSRLTAEGIRHQAEIERLQEAEKTANAQIDMHKTKAAEAHRSAGEADQRATEAEQKHAEARAAVERLTSPGPVKHRHSPTSSRPPISVVPGAKR